MKKMRKKLGEVLIEAGVITPDQLENALTLQKGRNKRLGKIIIELGYAPDRRIAEALSTQMGVPLIDCTNLIVPKEIVDLVPKEIAEKRIIIPIEKKNRNLLIAMADPLDWRTIDEIAFTTGLKVSVGVASETSILNAIEKHYGMHEKTWEFLKEVPAYEGVEFVKHLETEEDEDVNIQSISKLSEAPPIIRLVTMILVDAEKSRASDVHIEPMEYYVQVRYRVDGELRNILKFSKTIQDSVISRVKIISNLDITNRRLPQDGRSTLRIKDKNVELRISTLPTAYGEKIVIRLLDPTTGLIPLSQLGISERMFKELLAILNHPQGMLLVTGPTGSGKTTTLYAILQQLQSESENIVTIEDPIEYKLKGISQVGVNEPIGLTFANTLRSILRQDPDIIMVGEIRDKETVEIAVRSALTGHLVLSTVHTNDTVATITRLIDIGVEPFLVSSAVSGILAQRLIRKICPDCKEEIKPPEGLAEWNLPAPKAYYRGAGCQECQHTGYKGRIGIYEFLTMNTAIKRLIARRAPEIEIWNAAIENGTIPLFFDAWSKVVNGITTVEEVFSRVPYDRIESVPARSGTDVGVRCHGLQAR